MKRRQRGAKRRSAISRTRPKPKRRPQTAKQPKRAARPKPRTGRDAFAALEKQVKRLRSVRGRLERRLTAAVQEIGALRRFELRAQMLERQLAERDDEIARLRRETDERVRELESRLGGTSVASATP